MRAAAVIAVLLLGCGPVPVRPDPVDPDDDAAESCIIACATMQQLGCPGWRGSPGADEEYGTDDDVPCIRACVDVVEAYPGSTLYQTCVSRAETCDDVEACFGG